MTPHLMPQPLPGFEAEAIRTCRICERPLSSPVSMRSGIGPVCASKLGIRRTAPEPSTEEEPVSPRKRSAGGGLEAAVGDALRRRTADTLGITLGEDRDAAIETTGHVVDTDTPKGEPMPTTTRPRAAPGRDIVLIRMPDGTATADIPQTHAHHSRDGFEWGYGGPGPADLALNILALYLPRRGGQGVKLGDGSRVSEEAWNLHQSFTRAVIAAVPLDGATIPAGLIRGWIARHMIE